MPESASYSVHHLMATQSLPAQEQKQQPSLTCTHSKPHGTRPRSGSWGLHELHYYVDSAPHSHTGSRSKASGLLSRLKLHHNDKSISTFTSTLPSLPETGRLRRPPLPSELIQPELSTPHPSLAKSSLDKPLPSMHIPTLHPSVSTGNHTKKTRTGIKNIGRFFRSLGKSSNTAQVAVESPYTHLDGHPGDQASSTTTCVTFTKPCLEIGSEPRATSGATCAIVTTDAERSTASGDHGLSLQRAMRKHPTVDDLHLHNRHQTYSGFQRQRSLRDLGDLSNQKKPPFDSCAIKSTPAPMYSVAQNDHFSQDDGDDVECDSGNKAAVFDDDDTATECSLKDAHDSRIAGENLSKRLSGGHYGSAGGLIFSTLPTPDEQMLQGNEAIDTKKRCVVKGSLKVSESEPTSRVTSSQDKESIKYRSKSLNQMATQARAKLTSEESEENNDSDTSTNVAADVARRICEQDDSVYADMEHIAKWIGNGKPSSRAILKHYLALFDFTHLKLDEAFRQLCAKLYLKAETQQIDRILQEFAIRYWECNSECIFGSPDVIHAIVYSLLLLNTDLHVAQGDHKKMTRPAFVRNTMHAVMAQFDQNQNSHAPGDASGEDRETNMTLKSSESYSVKRQPNNRFSIHVQATMKTPLTTHKFPGDGHQELLGSKLWQSEIENVLREMYISIRNQKISDPSPKDKVQSNPNGYTGRQSLQIAGSRVSAFKRSVGTIMWKTSRESILAYEVPETDDSTCASPISPRSMTFGSGFPPKRSTSSIKSSFSHNSHQTHGNSTVASYQAVASLLHNSETPTSYTSAAPFYKEGLIVRKHLLERVGQKARHREWKECFMVVDRGDIRMYKFDSGNSIDHRRSMARASVMISRVNLVDALTGREMPTDPTAAMGGGDWLANAQLMGEIDLKHTLSNALPSGYSRQRRHTFALQEPNGGVYLFQVGSAEQVVEWVSTCNYWAARESKEPLMGGVSSLEYGWGPCLEQMGDKQEGTTRTGPMSFPAVVIHEWKPPVPPTVSSTLDETSQLKALLNHVKELNKELDNHREIKEKMELRFAAKTSNDVRAMINWENKSQYLLHEIIKYQNYCDAIEKSLTLQDKAAKEGQDKR